MFRGPSSAAFLYQPTGRGRAKQQTTRRGYGRPRRTAGYVSAARHVRRRTNVVRRETTRRRRMTARVKTRRFRTRSDRQ